MFLDYLALVLLLLSLTAVFYTFIYIHDLPHKIAKEREHPHEEVVLVERLERRHRGGTRAQQFDQRGACGRSPRIARRSGSGAQALERVARDRNTGARRARRGPQDQ